ncbi:MAG: sugar ABC transporter ATP-binding protein [Methylobacteriaceae bacterium]|nr:sugar ABC transporter ATP-binding protein [Methylobacteriaceae bacterium]
MPEPSFDGVAPLAATRGVSKRYGTTLALDNVSLKIHAGCSIAVAGRNGAGKSTMVRLLTGLDLPDAGEVRFAGKPAPDIAARAWWRSNVACVYQKSTVIPDLTVVENLFLHDHPASTFGYIHWREVRRLARNELELWGLEVDVDQRAGDLSVGERQRLEIARALRQGSRFIILDEPTARLESREISQLFDHVMRLKRAGVTFLFISHHLQEIYEICERVAVLRDGRLIIEAAVGDLDQGDLVAAMVGDAYQPTEGTGADPDARHNRNGNLGPSDPRPIVLDVDSVSVAGSVVGASLRIRAGERVGLAGLAGSGKSELAQAIVGQRKPDGGRILVEGQALPPGREDSARDIGISHVPEDRHANGFCGNLSVEENIALPVLQRISSWGFVSRRRRRAMANAMIARLQIKVSDAAQRTSELSGGNQQKTVMGRALASDPIVLVLEYPTAGVDITSKQTLFDIIRGTDAAVLLVSDEVDELAICDRVMVMFAGRIVREFASSWQEHEMVEAMEGLSQ